MAFRNWSRDWQAPTGIHAEHRFANLGRARWPGRFRVETQWHRRPTVYLAEVYAAGSKTNPLTQPCWRPGASDKLRKWKLALLPTSIWTAPATEWRANGNRRLG
jgi:hypothetical protein